MHDHITKFIDEPIKVTFNKTPLLEKTPNCPEGFFWMEQQFVIDVVINEWREYRRRGRREHNMSIQHAARARLKGSWGVGRFFFRVKVEAGRVFELYYDRAPTSVDDRKGNWFLLTEWIMVTNY